MLSVCLIVKDEEDYLPGCLASVQDADEIVVVDTGSQDRTVDVANEYTDQVFHYEWGDDFAAARNFAKAQATGDWIYSIDADHISETPIPEIRAQIKQIPGRVASITIDEHHKAAWLFRNDSDIKWEGRVHEVLNHRATFDTTIKQRTIPREAHTKRNLRILQKSPDTPRTRFYLGREYFDLGDYPETVRWMKRYLENPAFPAEEAEAWLTIAKAEWYLHQGVDAREACLRAIAANPDFTEALLLMSEMTFEPWRSKWAHIAKNSTNGDVLFNRIGKTH